MTKVVTSGTERSLSQANKRKRAVNRYVAIQAASIRNAQWMSNRTIARLERR